MKFTRAKTALPQIRDNGWGSNSSTDQGLNRGNYHSAPPLASSTSSALRR
jgi:hypothetical protein